MSAALIGKLLDVGVFVARSGFQFGGDAGTSGTQGRRLRIECKRYADKSALDVHVVVSTRPDHWDSGVGGRNGVNSTIARIDVVPFDISPAGELDQLLKLNGIARTDCVDLQWAIAMRKDLG